MFGMFEFGDVRFRPMEREDLKLLHSWENDFEVTMHSRNMPLNFLSMPQLEKRFEKWLEDERETRFIVELAESKEAIGIARIELMDWGNVRTADVGTYIGKKELWGKGLGKHIAVGLLEMCFNEMNLDRCEASSVEYNVRAHKGLESCGFKRSGVARKSAFVDGKLWDRYHFDILKEEYLAIRMELLKNTLGERLQAYLDRVKPKL